MDNNHINILNIAKNVLKIEADEIYNALNNIGESFVDAVKAIVGCKGRVVLSGMGKSGHIARKISSTLSSTGTPAFFMHPGEASHGDLGMIVKSDVIILFSNSGQSDELISILPNIKRIGTKIISLTNNEASEIALQSDIHINLNVMKEACPLGLSPTASSTVALALGDALAICVLEEKGFSAEEFKRSHPGGSLGKNSLVKVKDIMLIGNNIPMINFDALLGDAIKEISEKKVGFTSVVDGQKKPIGIFTDGDLRRAILNNKNTNSPILECMTNNPIILHEEQLAIDVVNIMETSKITGFLVTNKTGILIGILNLQVLLKQKVI
ncbi:KpsF/GutQ family sugar-phosphate isomerase [Methylophilaceae bacterium]|nr:KpsF/GutQ family sugar-phosphate isomerase [Methylophilaceae bacterium]